MTKLECVERECVSSVEPLRSRVEMRLRLVAGQANERVDQSTEVAVEALHFGFVAEARMRALCECKPCGIKLSRAEDEVWWQVKDVKVVREKVGNKALVKAMSVPRTLASKSQVDFLLHEVAHVLSLELEEVGPVITDLIIHQQRIVVVCEVVGVVVHDDVSVDA